ncbi:MAG TPA: LuxR C-terminal-related transcriptional regulator [Candidatus Elarobacter sp.]|nr:LuxR C-terminal-related transcriptional regulator [Candidatus Elarobacter sp.]
MRDEPRRFELSLLRARVLLRLDRADKAIEALRSCAYTPTSIDGLLTGEMLLGTAYVRLGQHERGEALLSNAFSRRDGSHATIRAELTLNLGIARYFMGHPDEAEALLADVPEDADIIHARALEYRGWIAFSRGRFDIAASWFRKALTRIERCRWHDRFVEANVLQGLATLNAELVEIAEWDAAERRIAAFDWTADGIARPRFWVAIYSSIMRETLGDEGGALDWARRAEQQAPNAAYRALALCHTSSLFYGLREPHAHLELAIRAKQLYETIDTRDLGPDQQQLPVFVAEQLAAALRYDDAERLMTHYNEVIAPMATTVAGDDRYAALRHAIDAAIHEARGDRNSAVRSYTQSLKLYVKTRYRRRAAGIALRLAHLTGARRYLRYATAALREANPRFWMAVDLAGLRDEALPPLTDNQRTILTMVAQGKTYKEIASQLGRSWKTVNNSVEQLRSKFGAGSRAELVAEALRRGVVNVGDRSRTAQAISHPRQGVVATG